MLLVESSQTSLPSLIDRAASALTNARSSAEVIEARDLAGLAYDAAKRSARFAKMKGAHDTLVAAAHRAQAHALEIEAQAKRRLADEYDAAQDRGEVRKTGNPNSSKTEELPGAGDLGLSHKDIHEARQIRDAEEADPGIVRRVLDEKIEQGKEPTKADLRKALKAAKPPKEVATSRGRKGRKKPSRQASVQEPRHDQDLRYLRDMWSASCESARAAFLKELGFEIRAVA